MSILEVIQITNKREWKQTARYIIKFFKDIVNNATIVEISFINIFISLINIYNYSLVKYFNILNTKEVFHKVSKWDERVHE